ncbi:DUF5008 domain-containing protein [Mucilaginibacter sabulilitoris]|uniref:DUF5008 domain-containing protein n=1 Tax=Mucilaginibacter sabulilitoris TaxID=1173583 RepID=A0ABZ0TG17_9SPHI|nr:DUF5008 domain-containing protein [Mucilaginibacter sabulilitoris]WPU91521.1 DUF5008 domain-containing protein [Mucilaginibacter sabulilitoris]
MRRINYIITLALVVFAMQACKKNKTEFSDPYGDGKPPLGVTLSRDAAPVPATGAVGTEVTFSATGLIPFKDKIKFMFNGEPGQVTEVTESTIKVKVPPFGSTGITSIAIDNQLVIGPIFKVNGLINIDPSFRATAGANNYVNQVYTLADGRNLVLGWFTNYDNKGIITPLNRIVRTSADGELDRTFRTGKAANGALSRVVELGGRYIIAGGFSGYNQRTENISNITSLNIDGSVDTIGIKTYRRPSQTDTTKYFPRFNGGTNDFISRIYKHQNKITATGNFRYYVSRVYTEHNHDFTRDTVILDSTEIRQVLRFNLDGSLDKTYRFNATTNKGQPSANGPIDSYMHTDADQMEKLVVFGNFTTFDQKAAGRLVRLSPDGTIDASFKTGTGADNIISSLTYNVVTKKYFITGIFRSYDGKPAMGMALLNTDGTLDQTFTPKLFEGGYPGFARQLDDGLIVVSGSFKKYDNVTRNGFMVLNGKGELAGNYNTTGPFSGTLNDIIQTKSTDGKRALLLIGGFYRFDNIQVSNIIRVTIE